MIGNTHMDRNKGGSGERIKKRRGSDGKLWCVSEKVLIKAHPIFIPLFPLMGVFLELQSSHEHKLSCISNIPCNLAETSQTSLSF